MRKAAKSVRRKLLAGAIRTKPAEDSLTKLAEEIEGHFGAIRRKLRQPLETEFARGNLTVPQRMVMQALVQSEGLSLKQLSAQVSLAHSTVSSIVDRLQAKGMVERRKDAADGRATIITASAAVRDFLSTRMPELIISPLLEALRAATAKDRTIVLRGLRKLRALTEGNT